MASFWLTTRKSPSWKPLSGFTITATFCPGLTKLSVTEMVPLETLSMLTFNAVRKVAVTVTSKSGIWNTVSLTGTVSLRLPVL